MLNSFFQILLNSNQIYWLTKFKIFIYFASEMLCEFFYIHEFNTLHIFLFGEFSNKLIYFWCLFKLNTSEIETNL